MLEKIKVVAKVHCNNDFAYVLNRMPSFTYTKLDWQTIIGEDEGMHEFYMYDRCTDRYKAFGGRKFQLHLADGNVEECHGQWWDGMNDTALKLFDRKDLCHFVYSTIEELKKCYVYTQCRAMIDWVKRLDSEYKGEIYDYWEFKKLIRNEDI